MDEDFRACKRISYEVFEKKQYFQRVFLILDHQMIFESAGDLPTSVEAKGEAGFFFPAPPSLFFAGKEKPS